MTTIAINAMILDAKRLSGIGHYTVQLALWFARINAEQGSPHRVLVICRQDAADHFASIEGVETMAVSTDGGRITRVLLEQLHLPRLLRRERVDAVLNPAFTGPVYGASRIVTTVHDLYFRMVPDLLPRAQRLFLSALVPFCCRRSTRVVTTSASTMRDLVHHYPDLNGKVSVVPMANRLPAPLTLPEAKTSDPPFVLLVAALTGNKNPEALVSAVAEVRRHHPDLILVHVGSDPDQRLHNAIMHHGADSWVMSRTGVSDADLQQLYQECICFAIPSLYEGFGLPLLEAQAFGAPAVSSNRASLPEVGGEGALYFDPTDVSAIAATITTLLKSPQTREALRRAGFANQARFSWEATARVMLDILLGHPTDTRAAERTTPSLHDRFPAQIVQPAGSG